MKSHKVWAIAFLWLLALPVATGQAPAPQSTPLAVGQGTIAAIKGTVSIRSPKGEAIPSQRGQILEPETVIETEKGSIVLDLQDGSQVQIKGHSRVVLKDPSRDKKFSLEMFIGQVVTKIQKKLGSTPSFRMGTPTAVITVRGTQFQADVDKKGKTVIHVFEGLVEVIGFIPGGGPVLLRPGFWTDVPPNRGPGTPRVSDPNERMRRESRDDEGWGGGRDRSGQDRSGQDRSGQDRSGQDRPDSGERQQQPSPQTSDDQPH